MRLGRAANRLAKLEERYAGYKVYDCDDEKIGKVDDLCLSITTTNLSI